MRILLLFIIILSSCKSKEVSVDTVSKSTVSSDISVLNEKARQDTTRTKKIQQTEEFTRIYESETIIEYDTEKQTVSKVTEKEKVTESGKQTKTDESENRGLTEASRDSSNHFRESKNMVDVKEEIKEDSVWSGFTKNLGKWLGLGLCIVLLGLMIWNGIKKKLFL